MPVLNPVSRKYTPPTCTLEIKARESPLSRWVKLPVFNQLEFKLSFDDPRQSQDKLVTIWGDRDELEDLCEAVEIYVQKFLDKPPSELPVSLVTTVAAKSSTTVKPNNGNGNGASPANTVNPFDGAAASPSLLPTKPGDSTADDADSNGSSLRSMLTSAPYLQPRGLVAHDLFLGPLATKESGPVVPLSALQLFDLATALDEYKAEMVALPKVNRRSFRLKSVPVWTYATAGALLALAGLTPAVLTLLNRPKTQTAVVVPTTSPTVPTPLVPETSPSPNTSGLPITPLPTTSPGLSTPNPTPSGLSSPNSAPNVATLPGPNSLGSTPLGSPSQFPSSPSGRIQTPARSSSGSLPGGSQRIPNPPAYNSFPTDSFRTSSQPLLLPRTPSSPSRIESNPFPQPQRSTPRNTRSRVAVAPNPFPQPQRSTPRNTRSRVAVAPSSSPQPQRSTRRSTRPQSQGNPRRQVPQNVAVIPRFNTFPSNPDGIDAPIALPAAPPSFPSRDNSSPFPSPSTPPVSPRSNSSPLASPSTPPLRPRSVAPQDTAALPRVSPSPAIPLIPDEPVAITQVPVTLATPSPSSSPSASRLSSNTPAGQERRDSGKDDDRVSSNSGQVDTQVAEVRNKLQQRWKPPQDLTQSLEYTLVVGGDGAIERIIPRSEAARKYMGSTGMPILDGKPFVSAIQGGRNSKIRVVLNSNGKVETLMER